MSTCSSDRIGLDLASRLPWSSLQVRRIIQQAKDDGFAWVSVMPFWGEVPEEYMAEGYVKYYCDVWNEATPGKVVQGWIQGNRRAPKLQDLQFPWFESMRKSRLREYSERSYALPVIITVPNTDAPERSSTCRGVYRQVLVEIHPNLRDLSGELVSGHDLVSIAQEGGFQFCFDTNHVAMGIRRREDGDCEISTLGEWQAFLPEIVKKGVLGLFDFHISQEEAATGSWDFQLEMLRTALKSGYKGDVRVQVVLPIVDQLLSSRFLVREIRTVLLKVLEEVVEVEEEDE